MQVNIAFQDYLFCAIFHQIIIKDLLEYLKHNISIFIMLYISKVYLKHN